METIDRGRLTKRKLLDVKIVDGTVSEDKLFKIYDDVKSLHNELFVKNNSTLFFNVSEENTIKGRFFWKKIEKKTRVTFYCETKEDDTDAVIRIRQAEEKLMNGFKQEINESLRRNLFKLGKTQRYESFAAIFNEAFEKIDDALKEDLCEEYDVKLSNQN